MLLAGLSLLATACVDTTSSQGSDTSAAKTELAGFSCPKRALTAGSTRAGPAAGAKLQIVTTVAPITSIVANVAGDKADVRGIVPEGTNSHTFEPKPSSAEVMTKADVVFVNGLKLEDPTRELAEQNRKKGSQVIEMGSLTLRPGQYLYDFSFPRAGGKPNPHLWTNPPMAACYAEIAGATLAKADPANAASYRRNAKAYVTKVDQLDRLMTKATGSMPAGNRELLTYHDAYAYFAVHYGWKVLGAIQVSSFEDPTPREVTSLIRQIKKEKVPAIFGSEVFPSPVLAQIAKETGVRYVDKLRDDDLPGEPGKSDHSYLGLMKVDFVTMVTNLGGDASKLEAFDPSDIAPDKADYPQ